MKGLDKAVVIFVEAHIEFTCAVCNKTTHEFPGTGDMIFECPGCSRFFKLDVDLRPLSREEVKKLHRVKKGKDTLTAFD